MKRFFVTLVALCALATPVAAAGFSDWAVAIIAGDDHAHSGAHSEVFDNARRDLVRAFAGVGFSTGNIAQFSVEPSGDVGRSAPGTIANGLWDVTNRAPGGCLVYFTSHGNPDGILIGDAIMAPATMARIIGNACGAKPTVVITAACYSGVFVPVLAAPNRAIMTAARPDRPSFGCGEQDKYTFFDTCMLSSLPQSRDFMNLFNLVLGCVAAREKLEKVDYPSEPQVFVGENVVKELGSWR